MKFLLLNNSVTFRARLNGLATGVVMSVLARIS
jgi:stringent starvation protein B